MRLYVVIIGVVVMLSGTYYMFLRTGPLANPPGLGGLGTTGLGILDVTMGIIIAKPSKVSFPSEAPSAAKVLVDRGVYGASVYLLAFFDNKLVMKRLATSKVTVLLGLLLILAGATLEVSNPLVGAAAGGVTGYVLQEFLTQRRRERILKSKLSESAGKGDIELSYDEIDDMRVMGNKMRVSVPPRIYRVNLPRGYMTSLMPVLETLIPGLSSEMATPPEKAP